MQFVIVRGPCEFGNLSLIQTGGMRFSMEMLRNGSNVTFSVRILSLLMVVFIGGLFLVSLCGPFGVKETIWSSILKLEV